MVNVYMNPENLEKRIAGLEEYAQSAIEAQATVHCMYLNDPIKTGESLGSLESAVVKAANEIKSHAEELRRCKTTMVNLNSNGVASHDLEGGINLQVANDSAGLETTDKFEKWAQGATDAHDLKERFYTSGPGGEAEITPSGRKLDEIRESMAANQNDPTYANSIVDNTGLENVSKCPAPDLMSGALATASQTWSKEKSEKNAKLMTRPLRNSSVSAFNPLIVGHDTNGDGVIDLRFGTDFLVSLGKEAEEVKPTQSGDPLTSVLEAMAANEEAARAYLTPRGGDVSDVKRVNELMNRNPIGNNPWTDAWTRVSFTTSEAHGADHYDGTDSGGSASKQAAAIASSVVNGIGEPIMKNKGYDSISGAARSNLRKTVSCYPYVFDNIATGTGDPASMEPEKPDQTDGAWSKGIGYQPKFTVAGLAGVTQTISRDENEFKALTDSVGELEKRRMTHAIANKSGDPDKDDGLGDAIKAKSDVAAFLMGASRAPIEGDADAIDKRNNLIIDSVFAGTAFIPGLGENVKQIWKNSYEFAKSNATNLLKNEATDEFTGNLSAAMKQSGIAADQSSKAASVSTVIQLIELGYIDKNSVNNTIDVTQDGSKVTVVNDEGKVDFSRMNPETVKQVMGQLYNRYAQESTHLGGKPHDAFEDSENSFDKPYNMGQFGNKEGK